MVAHLNYTDTNSSKCYFRQITLFIRCQFLLGFKLGIRVRVNVQTKYSNSMIFKNTLSASWPVRELSSPRLDWPRVGLSCKLTSHWPVPSNRLPPRFCYLSMINTPVIWCPRVWLCSVLNTPRTTVISFAQNNSTEVTKLHNSQPQFQRFTASAIISG